MTRNQGRIRYLGLLALAAGLATDLVRCVGETITLKPVADTSLIELSPDNNLGALADLQAGTINRGTRCRLLLRFDVAASIPAGATITSASLALTVSNSGSVDSVFGLCRLLAPWGEGDKGALTSTGEPATAGESTWRARAYPNLLWAQPGGLAGTDFAHTPSATLPLGKPGTYTFAATTALVADAQGWLDQPAANQGWLLLSQDEATAGTAKRIRSREAPGGAPVLTIDYVPPLPRPRIEQIQLVGDEVRLLFPVMAGKLYAVEYVESLPTTAAWQTLSLAGSKFFPTNWVATDSRLNATQRCYRLALVGDID